VPQAFDVHDGDALGLLESTSLARGLEADDAVRKEAAVRPLWTRAIEPGKLLVAFAGPVDAVRSSLRRGRAVLGDALAGDLLLTGPHPAVVRALAQPSSPGDAHEALGLVECATVAAAIHAADAAVKEADVLLFHVRTAGGMGGRGLVCLAGTEADVESAVYAGAERAEERAQLVRASVITGPATGLLDAAARL
jgi:microcompartment protein CcmL/EutN